MERICRRGEKKRYQPELTNQRIHDLYLRGQDTGKPMTVILDHAVRDQTARDDRADFEVILTDGTHTFVSYRTRNTYENAGLILGERNISTEFWEDQVELTNFLNQRERDTT
jgi:hypothetical protein